jgi:hypothetical protein
MTHDIDDVLMTSQTWSDYQALQLIETRLNASLTELSHEQRQRYVQLCRSEPQARQDLADAIQRFKTGFETTAYTELVELLRQKIGQTLDLHNTWLHTRMLELPERKGAKDPVELLSNLLGSRSKRALSDNAVREHVNSRTLWRAAKENFAFDLGSGLHSGLDFQRASTLNMSSHDPLGAPLDDLDVAGFIEVIRQFDFATRLRQALAEHLITTINPLIVSYRTISFELDVLEAARTKTISGQPLHDSVRLLQAQPGEKGLEWKFFQLQFGIPLLGQPATLALPFCVIRLPYSSGVFSYFPHRPQGALRHHADPAQAVESLREQICADATANRIDWLLRGLSLADQATLLGELKTRAADESQLNWLAKHLYHAFASQASPATRIHIRAEPDSPRPPAHSLLSAIALRQSSSIAADLQSLATSTANRDVERITKTLKYIGSEILELLTLPAPGGVTGLNRLMLGATLGMLTHNTLSAGEALARGQSAEFVQALGDIADLAISGRIQGIGAQLSAQRTRQLIKAMGKPREVELSNGERSLWLADLRPYTSADAQVLNGLSADAEGLFKKHNRLYARVQVDDQTRIGELTHDAELGQYRLKHPDPQLYQPVLSYDQRQGRWHLAPIDVSHLTRTELLQTMLRPDLPALSREDVQHLQELTQVTRAQLEAVWHGEDQAPSGLAHAIRDLQWRRGLDQLQRALETPDSPLPAFADRVLPLLEALRSGQERVVDTLKNNQSTLHSALMAQGAIGNDRTRTRLITALNTLNDPSGRGMAQDGEAIACNLLTAQSGWPEELCIQVYQGARSFSGAIFKTNKLLATYGHESATRSVMLARLGEHYAGYDQTNDDMLQPASPEYPLTSMLLRTLTDTQREGLNYQIHEGRRLAETLFSQAQLNVTVIEEWLLPPGTFELSAARLAPFQLAVDFSGTLKADSEGLYTDNGKRYVQIGRHFFQALHDLDASSPARKVMRIVRPVDPVANDAGNIYVASRAGRSEPITRNKLGLWVGAVVGLVGGGPKADRLKEIREKTEAERVQYVMGKHHFTTAANELLAHLEKPNASAYLIQAGDNYYKLKHLSLGNLHHQMLLHAKIAKTDFAALPTAFAHKREVLIEAACLLDNVSHNYAAIIDVYTSSSELEVQALSKLPVDLRDPAPFDQMQASNKYIISAVERLQGLAHDEIDRLLTKLDEFPEPPEPETRARPAPGKKKKLERASPATPQPAPTPKNRVEIRTQDDQILSGKPRSDNPNIVDILDSRGQRKATYLLSSNGQYWVENSKPRERSASGNAAPVPTWASYEVTARKLLSEARHGESLADYLGRKNDSAPSAPQGLLEYQANRLEEQAQDIHDTSPQFGSAEDRRQALNAIRELREQAQYLRQKGQNLRLDLIISNNAPNANDLQYLADSNNLSVRRTHEQRITMERVRKSSRQHAPRDYIDEFELKIKDRNRVWAYAHLHYAEPASDAPAFGAAHLKRPEQRFQGAHVQIQEAQSGRRHEIHRGTLVSAQVREILLSERFV